MRNIVLFCGTSGSGKTHAARAVIAAAQAASGEPRVAPLGPQGRPGALVWEGVALTVLGRYDATCGGCDAQSWKGAADDQELLALTEWGRGHAVLLEGLMVSTWGMPRLQRIHGATDGHLHLLHLDTDLQTCLDSVQARREERARAAGREATPLDPENTTSKHTGLARGFQQRGAAGLHVEAVSRQTIVPRALELLGLA